MDKTSLDRDTRPVSLAPMFTPPMAARAMSTTRGVVDLAAGDVAHPARRAHGEPDEHVGAGGYPGPEAQHADEGREPEAAQDQAYRAAYRADCEADDPREQGVVAPPHCPRGERVGHSGVRPAGAARPRGPSAPALPPARRPGCPRRAQGCPLAPRPRRTRPGTPPQSSAVPSPGRPAC